MSSQIFITGMPRSGSSMIAAAVNMCGAFGGTMTGKHSKMFENIRIRETLVKPYFERLGFDKAGQYPLPEREMLSIPTSWKAQVETILQEEGYKGGEWMYKDAKLCLMWPVWNYAYPNAKWVIVRRKTSDIIKSCTKTGFMTAFKDKDIRAKVDVESEEEGWLWMTRQYERRMVDMITEGLNCKVIWPERMVDGDYRQLHELCEWLGLPWKSEALTFIDPLLWGRKKKGA